MFRPLGWLVLLLLLLPHLGHAQWAVTNWVSTRVDDHLVVELPYVTEVELDKKEPGTRIFSTETESIVLVVGSVDLRYSPKYFPDGTVTVASLNKYFNRILRAQVKGLKHMQATLVSQANVVFAGSPARAVRFRFTDDVRDQPAYLDFIYLWRGDHIYMLATSYRLPETADTIADRKRFLKSVVFGDEQPTREF
ncbi:hypothetical protein E5K00_12300 [Hymenobacter aquaticus]|uniref:DUF1795 domain-containing protein n=1 Tax=Hymenobacter aquaticus TaxID=1867101 RepID=A0A4Z0Q9W8_9BACT|nr:hypothetical protein [Hymenobacter aquaticus]TGE25933.1 hypothetical protein E5K00_12300 [Hymenobacter aquaticus]